MAGRRVQIKLDSQVGRPSLTVRGRCYTVRESPQRALLCVLFLPVCQRARQGSIGTRPMELVYRDRWQPIRFTISVTLIVRAIHVITPTVPFDQWHIWITSFQLNPRTRTQGAFNNHAHVWSALERFARVTCSRLSPLTVTSVLKSLEIVC